MSEDLEPASPPEPPPPPPAEAELVVEQPAIVPQTEKTAPDFGTKLFVIFFMVLVPPLGIAMVVAMIWSLWKLITSNA